MSLFRKLTILLFCLTVFTHRVFAEMTTGRHSEHKGATLGNSAETAEPALGPEVGGIRYPTLAMAYAAAQPGQTIMVPADWNDPTWAADLVMNKSRTGFRFLGSCAVQQGEHQLIVASGTVGAFIQGPGNGFNCTFYYTGAGSAHQFGRPDGTGGVNVFNGSNYGVNITRAHAGAIGIDAYALGNSFFANVGISGAGGAAHGQIGLRLGHDSTKGENDSANNTFNNLFVGSTSIGIQEINAELNFFYNLVTTTDGSVCGIVADIEGGNSDYFIGGTVSGYQQVFKCNFCFNFYVNMETESGSGQPDVSFSDNSSGNTFLLGGSVAKNVMGTGVNNLVCHNGSGGCILGSTGAGKLVFGDSPALSNPTISNPTTTGIDNGAEVLKSKTLQGLGAGGTDIFTLTPDARIFNSSGMLSIPTGVSAMECTVVGGGGAGGGATNSAPGCGGGSGGVSVGLITNLTPGRNLEITVGTGGKPAPGASGGNGTVSSISSGTQNIRPIQANGGEGGDTGTHCVGGNGGDASGGSWINSTGNYGLSIGNAANLGGGGGAGPWGGAGRGASAGNPGSAGGGPGAGGGGAFTSTGGSAEGGAGANGIVVCRYVH